jgi:hypothetical protein
MGITTVLDLSSLRASKCTESSSSSPSGCREVNKFFAAGTFAGFLDSFFGSGRVGAEEP